MITLFTYCVVEYIVDTSCLYGMLTKHLTFNDKKKISVKSGDKNLLNS
jgi:hypothetical protein